MILLGYNFCSDVNALDPTPTNIQNINYTKLQNGIFDHFNVLSDTTFTYTSVIPDDWTLDTLMNADFKGSASAGNIGQLAAGITSVRIKRREAGTFDWMTIREIPISDPAQLSFITTDNFNENNKTYEYAFVPMNNTIEGNYIIETIESQFNGVFLCDADTVYKYFAGVSYGMNESVQQQGVFQPFSRQYPVIINNGLVNYERGSISGTILPPDFNETKEVSREEIVTQRKILLDFLKNKKAKILKDLTIHSGYNRSRLW